MMERRHAPDARDGTGKLIADCYCPRCNHFSGGSLCRICKQEVAIKEREAAAREEETPPVPAHEPGQSPLL